MAIRVTLYLSTTMFHHLPNSTILSFFLEPLMMTRSPPASWHFWLASIHVVASPTDRMQVGGLFCRMVDKIVYRVVLQQGLVDLRSGREFLRLVGSYRSNLLPKQGSGTSQIQVKSTQPNCKTTRITLYCVSLCIIIILSV